MKNDYQKRKGAGQCVRSGRDRKPKIGPNGKRRSYCQYHTDQHAKNSAAWLARQKAPKKPKLVRTKKVAPRRSPTTKVESQGSVRGDLRSTTSQVPNFRVAKTTRPEPTRT